MRNVFVTLVLAFCFAPYSSYAEFTERCENDQEKPLAKSIGDLIKQSEFIGLFVVVSSKPKNELETDDLPVEINEYELELADLLTGSPPNTIKILGGPSYMEIPEHYFFLKERHQELTATENLDLGITYRVRLKDGNCKYLPEFLVGYSYLIFYGANSGAAYEPVFSTRYDPFYLEIERRIRHRD